MSDLPVGWVETTFGEVTEIIGGSTPSSKVSSNFTKEGGTPWITPSDLSGYKEIYISHGTRNLSDRGVRESSARVLPAGSVLFSSRAPVGYVAIAANEVSTNQGFKSFILPEELDGKFIYFYLRHIKPVAEMMATGTTFKELSASNAAKLPLIIAPLNEQKRIAEKLEQVLSRVDSCQSHLERVWQIFKSFRQSVLAAAISGRLTEDWRKRRGVDGEWDTVQLSEIAASRLGKMLDTAKNRGELRPYLRNINVRWFSFDLRDIQELRISEEEAKTLGVRKRDVLVCEGGEPGRCAVWYGEDDIYLFQKALHRVRVSEKLLPEWLCYCLKSSADSGRLADYLTGTTIKHLTGVSLSRFEFDLPSLEEQTEIVRRVESLFAYAERLEAHYQSANEQVKRLIPSLLAKAFRGELVAQDPHDEPASVLLESIRAARNAQPVVSRRSIQSKETRMYKMEETLEEIIQDLALDMFSFEDLQEKYFGDYERLKDELFTMLDSKAPIIALVFDESSQSMMFVRRKQ